MHAIQKRLPSDTQSHGQQADCDNKERRQPARTFSRNAVAKQIWRNTHPAYGQHGRIGHRNNRNTFGIHGKIKSEKPSIRLERISKESRTKGHKKKARNRKIFSCSCELFYTIENYHEKNSSAFRLAFPMAVFEAFSLMRATAHATTPKSSV